jgi:hypothetical protein
MTIKTSEQPPKTLLDELFSIDAERLDWKKAKKQARSFYKLRLPFAQFILILFFVFIPGAYLGGVFLTGLIEGYLLSALFGLSIGVFLFVVWMTLLRAVRRVRIFGFRTYYDAYQATQQDFEHAAVEYMCEIEGETGFLRHFIQYVDDPPASIKERLLEINNSDRHIDVLRYCYVVEFMKTFFEKVQKEEDDQKRNSELQEAWNAAKLCLNKNVGVSDEGKME